MSLDMELVRYVRVRGMNRRVVRARQDLDILRRTVIVVLSVSTRMVGLFFIRDSLKMAIMEKIKRRTNMRVARVAWLYYVFYFINSIFLPSLPLKIDNRSRFFPSQQNFEI